VPILIGGAVFSLLLLISHCGCGLNLLTSGKKNPRDVSSIQKKWYHRCGFLIAASLGVLRIFFGDRSGGSSFIFKCVAAASVVT
jgi:hypothetical protein